MHFFQAFLSFPHLYLDFILIAAPKIFPRKNGALLQVPCLAPEKLPAVLREKVYKLDPRGGQLRVLDEPPTEDVNLGPRSL